MAPRDDIRRSGHGLHVVTEADARDVLVASDLEQLCRAGVAGLAQVAGAVVHLAPAGVASGVSAASLPEWRRIGELADATGEGPCVDAARLLRPVMVPDLAAARDRWPVYAGEVSQHGVAGVFSFPMQVGAVCLGVLDLYSATRDDLDPSDLALALAIAQVATSVLLTRVRTVEGPDDPLLPLVERLAAAVADHQDVAEVHQAQGIVMVVLGVDVDEALLVMRARALALGRHVADLAREVVSGAVDPRTWWRDDGMQGPRPR